MTKIAKAAGKAFVMISGAAIVGAAIFAATAALSWASGLESRLASTCIAVGLVFALVFWLEYDN